MEAIESPTERTIETGAAARSIQNPYLVALAVGVLYLGLLVWLWGHFGGDPLGFVHRGTIFTQHDPAGTWGYDGQFYYYTATDPLHAAEHMDNPTFRLQRVFYPLLIIAVSLGQRDLAPYAMLLINWLSVVGGTLLVALMLRRWGRSPWFALSYALASGIPVALTFDTAEPLTFALVALGVYFWNAGCGMWNAESNSAFANDVERTPSTEHSAFRIPHSAFWAALAFAAALLTRELAGYFVVAYGFVALLRRDWRGLALAVVAFLPVTLWSAYLSATMHYLGVSFAQPFEHIPFLAYWLQLREPGAATLRSVGYAAQYIIPTAVFGTLALWRLLQNVVFGMRNAETGSAPVQGVVATTFRIPHSAFRIPNLNPLLLAVLGNAHLMTFLPHNGYQHQVAVSRYMLGLALAAVLWAGSERPRWLLWLTPLFVVSLLAYIYGLIRQDPAYLW